MVYKMIIPIAIWQYTGKHGMVAGAVLKTFYTTRPPHYLKQEMNKKELEIKKFLIYFKLFPLVDSAWDTKRIFNFLHVQNFYGL